MPPNHWKLDKKVSLTSIATIVMLVLGSIAWLLSIENTNANQDRDLKAHEHRIERAENVSNEVKETVIRMEENQRNQEKMLKRIVDYLERRDR